ncbi:hypothetical protein M8371_32585, partial [Klebsiella pneumoniae]|nr:hypothetical protein [Klebsiella pneumoniae]
MFWRVGEDMGQANQLGKSRQKGRIISMFHGWRLSAPYLRASENGYKFICMTKQKIPSIKIHLQNPILFLQVPPPFFN